MSKQTDKSLFITSSLPRLYQFLLGGIKDYKGFADQIIKEINVAQSFRQVERVAELSQTLINSPIDEYRLIGRYYLAWSRYRDNDGQLQMLERVIEQSKTYKTKALTFRGALSIYRGSLDEALFFYLESLKSNPTISEYLLSVKEIAVIKSIEGFKRSALNDLERLLPLLKHSEPFAAFDVLNSYAVELGEAGRKHEARNIIQTVLRSPFAVAYPEWHETAQDLSEPDRSFVSIPQPVPSAESEPVEIETEPAIADYEGQLQPNILPFQKLKEAPEPQKPEKVTLEELGEMTSNEKREFIMTALRSGAIRASRYDAIIIQAGLLKSGPPSKVIDLEDDTVLNDLVIEWVNLIDPEDLAGVISALRDCNDDLRRADIMDTIIRKAFENSTDCGVSEDAWRERVERHLPRKK